MGGKARAAKSTSAIGSGELARLRNICLALPEGLLAPAGLVRSGA